MHANTKDIAGKRFGRLVVLRYHSNPDGYARWECACDCGEVFIGRGHTLREGTANTALSRIDALTGGRG